MLFKYTVIYEGSILLFTMSPYMGFDGAMLNVLLYLCDSALIRNESLHCFLFFLLWNYILYFFGYRQSFSFQNIPKNLDPSYKMGFHDISSKTILSTRQFLEYDNSSMRHIVECYIWSK